MLGNHLKINFVDEWKVKLIFIQQPNNSLECSVLRIIIPNEYNGSIQTKAIPVRPHTTTKDVCRIIAHKSQITNPMDYGLFKLIDGEGKYLIKEFALAWPRPEEAVANDLFILPNSRSPRFIPSRSIF